MFQLADENATYEYPVTVRVPGQGGVSQEMSFKAHFRLVPETEAKEMSDSGMNDKDYFKRIIAGWDDIQNSNGKPLPYNDTNLEKLADIRYFAVAVAQAYNNFAAGLPAKNFKPPRAH